ncbi:3-oxoadipate enol-lactonase [Pigmentiphaga aceris]|uniref:3-oxoadipate enol-lactonase n=1 Tax=Pigmentiphaga aceris TaxID=1940612 RepID=A0A5C0B217_9BURK|nr:3-oxoadipate enol-lactonase [Pigmentiphaga aceris]QEI07763.1 3-oxoadipate enol-lactonase [Pigmentiphaga aceris]
MAFADLNDLRIHYQLDGDAGKPVLMLSNSLGATLDMWAPQLAALTQDFQVLRYDARGHGQSTITQGPYSIAQLGQDAVALLDALGILQAHFAGVSMGGLTGQWIALNQPARLKRLVLANTAAYIGPPENWTTRADKVKADGIASIASAVVSRWITPDYAAATPALAAKLLSMVEANNDQGYASACIAVRDADFRAQLGKITTPTLVIAGTHDIPTPPSDGKFLADHIPGARYVELSGAHLTNLEAVDGFNQAVRDFLLS